MATAINAMRVPDTLATPTPARAGGIGSRVDAEGAARVRFPYFREIPEDAAEILLGPSWTAGTWGPAPPPRCSPRCLVQRGRPQRRGNPGELREQGSQASLVVVGEEEGQPVSVDAPHDRFDIERRPVGRVEVQLSDAALTEPLRRPHLGPPATDIDGLKEKDPLPGLHHHGPRHGESRVSPWASLGGISLSKCRIGVDRACSRRTIRSRSGPCTHVGLLRNMGCAAVQADCILA